MVDIAYHNIHIFQAPTYENEDEETIAEAEEIASKIPFAVVGSDQIVTTPDGRQVRGRAYPWGVVEVDNEEHCDFVKLRQMLVRTYMEELREYTNDVLYENWRTEKLLSMGVAQDSSVFKEIKYVHGIRIHAITDWHCSPAARLQEERILHEAKLAKMEAEMKMVFQQKVAEKESKLKQSEEELYARHKEMKDALEKQRADLEDKKKRIESGRSLTPDKGSVRLLLMFIPTLSDAYILGHEKEGIPPHVECHVAQPRRLSSRILFLKSFVTADFVPSLRLPLYIILIKLLLRLSPSSCLTPHSFHHINRLLLYSRSVLFSLLSLCRSYPVVADPRFELIYHGSAVMN